MDHAAFWVEIIAALTIPASFAAVIFHRVKREMGFGYRAVQFLALGTALPIVLILGLEKIIEPGTIGTILGAVLGYVFSSAARTAAKPDA